MANLLEVILTFAAAMLILALIAQSVQEAIKITFAVKGKTRLGALEALIVQSALATELSESDGRAILRAVTSRLGNLGQDGVRPNKLRLDALTAKQLAELIRSVSPDEAGSLKAIDPKEAKEKNLPALAAQAEKWFPIAMTPVSDRYRRRMRGLSFLAAGIVVLALNANALDILQKARQDDSFRAQVQATALRLDSLSQHARAEAAPADSQASAAPSDSTDSAATGEAVGDTVLASHAAADSLQRELLTLVRQSDFLLGSPGHWHVKDPRWWLGILASVLLVGLGAPFWHDTLEALFGLKSRVIAQAAKTRSETERETSG